MSDFQEEHSFPCPSCGSVISIPIDLTAGNEQTFTTDCEICCRPMVVTVLLDESGISHFDAVKESDSPV